MPPRAQGRPPTAADLSPEQRRIYDHIQGEEIRELYLASLPPIRESPASRRQAEQLRRRLQVLAALQRYSEAEAQRLTELLPQAERGRTFNLNRELAPPPLVGVVLRFTRRIEVTPAEGTAAAPRAARPAAGARERPSAPARPRRAKGEPDDPRAPFGRDLEGTPFAPWGYKKDGTPARPKGSTARAEEQIDNFVARRATNPALTAEEVERKGGR
jgi:hypothetical protein